MEPAALLAELLRNRVDERRCVVLEHRLELRHALGARGRRLLRDRAGRSGRDDPELGPGGRRGQLDLEPGPQLALVRPDAGHGRAGVAGDHWTQSRDRRGLPPPG